MRTISYVLAFIVLAGAPLYPQHSEQHGFLAAIGGGRVSQRAYARILYTVRGANTYPGEFIISYGQPAWRSDYEDPVTFDQMTKGQVWRMGESFWTVLDTNLPLKIGGKDIAVGAYYLGVYRSEDGSTWSLAVMDPSKVRQDRLDAVEIAKATVEFMVPMTFAKSEKVTEKLTITLESQEENLMKVTLRVAWGNLLLTAPVQVIDLE